MPTDRPFRFFGVLHLPPLPAAPRPSRGFADVYARALADADALVAGGADGCILENLGDAPFTRGAVDPHVSAALAILGDRLRQRFGDRLALGINVLRNDPRAALAVAAACGADLVRVNVHAGATWTDQGLIQGDAHHTLRYRRELGADAVRIAADVLVKHGVPAGSSELGQVARDTAGRGGADLLIVTGVATGAAAGLDRVRVAVEAVPDTPVWVGSGVTHDSAAAVAAVAAGAIVGTALHTDGQLHLPLDPARVARLREAFVG